MASELPVSSDNLMRNQSSSSNQDAKLDILATEWHAGLSAALEWDRITSGDVPPIRLADSNSPPIINARMSEGPRDIPQGQYKTPVCLLIHVVDIDTYTI